MDTDSDSDSFYSNRAKVRAVTVRASEKFHYFMCVISYIFVVNNVNIFFIPTITITIL